jgi:hypothetical protein
VLAAELEMTASKTAGEDVAGSGVGQRGVAVAVAGGRQQRSSNRASPGETNLIIYIPYLQYGQGALIVS